MCKLSLTELEDNIKEDTAHSGRLDAIHLPKEIRLLIGYYGSDQKALGSRYGMPVCLLGFSDCRVLFLGKMPFSEVKVTVKKSES